jgi:hypothetical protein
MKDLIKVAKKFNVVFGLEGEEILPEKGAASEKPEMLKLLAEGIKCIEPQDYPLEDTFGEEVVKILMKNKLLTEKLRKGPVTETAPAEVVEDVVEEEEVVEEPIEEAVEVPEVEMKVVKPKKDVKIEKMPKIKTPPVKAKEPEKKIAVQKVALKRMDSVIAAIRVMCKKGATIKEIMDEANSIHVKAGGVSNPTATNVNNYSLQALTAFDVLAKDVNGIYKFKK